MHRRGKGGAMLVEDVNPCGLSVQINCIPPGVTAILFATFSLK
jgi:hypothetical protein